MFKNIISTISTKVLLALMSFLIVTITSNNLGSEKYGYISLIILGITMVQMVNNFVGGPALVYLIPRYNLFKIFIPSYLWAFISAIIVTFVLHLLNLIPRQYSIHILCLSFISSINSINQIILLGKEKINKYNLVTTIQLACMLLSLSVFFIFLKHKTIESFIFSLYIQYISGAIIGYFFIRKDISKADNLKNNAVVKEILKYGSYVQVANIVQFMNYRLSYFIIDFYAGKAILGIYTVGVQLAEGLWLIGNSLALVQYSKISNSKDPLFAKIFSIQLLKVSILSTFLLIIPIYVLPTSFFQFVFGSDFTQVKEVFLFLSPGIISIAGSLMFSHYFSGLGKHYINTIGSILGLVFTLIAGFILIPKYGLIGASMTASISYFTMAIFQMIVFLKISKTKITELLITKNDISLLTDKIKEVYITIRNKRFQNR